MLKNYLKIAFRNLWRHRGFSFLNITGLAIGLTAGFLMLMYVAFELSYDNFHTKGDDIYRVVANIKTPTDNIEANKAAVAVPPNLQRTFPEVLSAVRIMNIDMVVRNNESRFQESNTVVVDSAFFDVFDFKLIQGDTKTVLTAPYSIVLSETAAQKYFGEENPMGKSLSIMEEKYNATVTGVMQDIPGNSQIDTDVLLSMTTYSEDLEPDIDTNWGGYDPTAYVLLAPGTDPSALEAKLPEFLEQNNGDEMRADQMFVTLFLEPLKEVYLYSDRGGDIVGNINNVYTFAVIALFILLIACINFINLTTARSVERAKEVGVRKVIGAKKNQLSLQFIGESMIISFFAFLITLVLAAICLPLFNTLAGKTISIGIFSNPLQILILFIVSMVLGILAGVYPAMVLSSFQPVSVLKGTFSTSSKGIFLRKGLVIAQFTISIVLIIGTMVIYQQTHYMQSKELGFDKDQILVLNTPVSPAQKELRDVIDGMQEVKSTGLGSSIPGRGNFAAYSQIENKNGDMQIANLDLYFVDYDYIDQLAMKVIAGRTFSEEFATDSTEAMVVNQRTIKLLGYSDPKEALGAKFDQWGQQGQIIGVIQDFHFRSLAQNIAPLTMRMAEGATDVLTVKIDSKNIQGTVAAIEDQWARILPDTPFEYTFMDEEFNQQYQDEIRFGNLFMNFAILAIFISCLGLLGLAAYSTLQRKKEIGIRKVVGSSVTGVLTLLSKDFIKLVGVAFLIAAPVSWLLMDSWLNEFAYRIDIPWWTFVLSGISALAIALATVSFHALKASLANPVNSLRTE